MSVSNIGGGSSFGAFDSLGMDTSQLLQTLGLPGAVGDAVGAQIDAQTGDFGGMFSNLMDMFQQGVGDMAKLLGGGLAPAGFTPRPFDMLAQGMATPLAQALGAPPGFNPLGGATREAPFGTGELGRAMERAIKRDPLFKNAVERAVGGVIVPDGRNDGRLTVFRPNAASVGDLLKNTFAKGLLARSGIAAALGGIGTPLAMNGPLQSLVARLAGNLANFAAHGPHAHGHHGAAAARGGGGSWREALGPDAAAFAEGMGVDLANASFEDILFLLLMKYAKKKEDDIMKKVKQLDQSMQKKEAGGAGGGGGGDGGGVGGAGGGGGGKGGGGVGGAGGAKGAGGPKGAKGAGGPKGAKGAGGPKGAKGAGGPKGAKGAGGPKGAKGSKGAKGNVMQNMVGGASGAGGGGDDGGGGGGRAGDAGGTRGGGGGGGGQGLESADLGQKMDASKMSDTMKQQMLQKLMGDLQKLYEMLSNMIKTMHDMQMTPVRNLRG